jgi:hypothetical protein
VVAKLVRYDLPGGGSIVVEESVDDSRRLCRLMRQDRSGASEIEDALASPRPATAAVMAEVRGLIDGPSLAAGARSKAGRPAALKATKTTDTTRVFVPRVRT